ncbi:MAG: alkaline phosphatase D family protein [Chitinophagales bacterium]
MRKLLSLSFLFLLHFAYAQDYNSNKRLSVDPALVPFYHGVASGDPLSDAVIIWTRVTTQDPSITVNWAIATDTSMQNIVNSGTANSNASLDYTVKVDVTGLNPASTYYYQFEYDGAHSLIGRTKTAPNAAVDQLRFAVVSCSRYEDGFFNAYESIAWHNDIDAVIHLGDYIYEYAVGTTIADRDTLQPPNEIITLEDYRIRHAHYRLDEQLRLLQQQYAMITTWDDHETANNSWTGGADNHDPGTEGSWANRKAAGIQAYMEWLPVRQPMNNLIYRVIEYGPLAKIMVLDTRLEGRDEQVDATNTQAINDTARTILGKVQFDWLNDNLSNSTSTWNVLAQQVMMASLQFGGQTFNSDQWDGYNADREKLYAHILDNNIENVVVLTGDIHTSWANNLENNAGDSVAVEFVSTSITSSVPDFLSGLSGFVLNNFDHVKYAKFDQRGYNILTLDSRKAQTDFYFMNTISEVDTGKEMLASWYVPNTGRQLKEATGPAEYTGEKKPFAPLNPKQTSVSIEERVPLTILGVYPNPAETYLQMQYYSPNQRKIQLQVIDLNGRVLIQEEINRHQQGVNYLQMDISKLAKGTYWVHFNNGEETYQKQIVKL